MRGRLLRGGLLVLALSVMVTGCWDAKELEQMIYLNALGFDYKDGEYTTYAQIVNFSNLGKQEGGARMPEEVWVGRGYGSTIDIATDNLYPSSQQRISWAHVKGVVLSEAALKTGQYDEMFDSFNRYPEIRHEMSFYATKESLEKLLTAKPILNQSAFYTRLINPKDIYRQYSLIKPLTIRELGKYLHEPASTMAVPFLRVNSERWKANEKGHPVMEVDGAAFVKNKKYKGSLDRIKLLGMRWVQKGSSRAPVYLRNEKGPVGVLALLKPKCKIKYRIVDGKPRFSLQIKASGPVIERTQAVDEKELIKLGTKKVEEEVRGLYREGLSIQADVLGLEETLYRKDPKLWKKLTKGGDLSLDEQTLENVEVKVKLISTGKMKLKSFY